MELNKRIFLGAAAGAAVVGAATLVSAHPVILGIAVGAAVLLKSSDRSRRPQPEARKYRYNAAPAAPVRNDPPRTAPAVPDLPRPFGYKICWAAIRADDPAAVAAALGFTDPEPANWESGMSAAEEWKGVFVSPPVEGYVLAAGLDGFPEILPLLERAARSFEDVQYFGSHRVSDYYCWARYLKGELIRGYCIADEVLWDEGNITPEERALGFDRFPLKEEDWEEETGFPDEEDVLRIAGAWGVNPATLDQWEQTGVGLLCRLQG